MIAKSQESEEGRKIRQFKKFLESERDKCNEQYEKWNYKNRERAFSVFQRACGINLALKGLHNIIYGSDFLIPGFNDADFVEEPKIKQKIKPDAKKNGKLLKKIASIESQLANQRFLDNAPADLVEEKRKELEKLKEEV